MARREYVCYRVVGSGYQKVLAFVTTSRRIAEEYILACSNRCYEVRTVEVAA